MERSPNYYLDAMEKCAIPKYLRANVAGYICNGDELGGFLAAVFENNLVEAAARADEFNTMCLRNYAQFLFSYAPRGCWGSPEIVSKWMVNKGLRGRAA